MNYSCIIVDDELKASVLLSDLLKEYYEDISVQGIHNDWKSAFNAIKDNQPDILFMDIQMPQKTGMDLLRLLPEIKSEIIFVTAYSEYALDAFNFPVAGYILKPINDNLFIKTVDKTLARISNKKHAEQRNNDTVRPVNKIGIPNNKGTDYVNIDSIIYLEATNRYTNVVTTSERLLSSYSIGRFCEMLDSGNFYKVHRSFIINLDYVKRYETSGIVIMTNDHEIPVSKNSKDDFLKQFDKISK